MEKAKNLIAFLFQRSGKTRLDEKELYMSLSYELRWFTPEKAKIFLHKSVENGLLKSEGEEYCPTFDYQNVQIPLGFTADESMREFLIRKGHHGYCNCQAKRIPGRQ